MKNQDVNIKNFNFSDEELARDWTLTDRDKKMLFKFQKRYRPLIAIEICAVRLYGRFLRKYNDLSSRIITYIYQQLGLPATLQISLSVRRGTFFEHRNQILNYLEFKQFDDIEEQELQNWIIATNSSNVVFDDDLLSKIEQFLLTKKIMLPGRNSLKRLVNSFCINYNQKTFNETYNKLNPSFMEAIDNLLQIEDDEQISTFNLLKKYPPKATITNIKTYLKRYQLLLDTGISKIDISHIEPNFCQYLFKLGKYYNAFNIKRFKSHKKYTIMTVFLNETFKITLDYLIDMHDQYIANICRGVKNIYEEKQKKYRKQSHQAIDNLIKVTDTLLSIKTDDPIRPSWLYKHIGDKQALQDFREDIYIYQTFIKQGYTDLLKNRYSSMRKYFVDFIQLPFEAEKGSCGLLKSIYIIRQLDSGELKSLPQDTQCDFIDKELRKNIYDKNGYIQRNIWELGVAIAMRDALKSGDLYIAQSKNHVSFWDLVYDLPKWSKQREQLYEELGQNINANDSIKILCDSFHKNTNKAENQFGLDGFANIKNGKLILHRDDKIEEGEDVKYLQQVINDNIPKIRIEQLLFEVDQKLGFSRLFTPIHKQKSTPKGFYKTMLAALLSQATNMGVITMQNCSPGISVDQIRYILNTYIREETIKAANSEIVNSHSALPLSSVHGKGIASSSDGQRFGIIASSLLSSFYPRYYGYYEKAIGIYTHVSDQYSVFNTKIISCGPREALYVLDGLLENNTVLNIKSHMTDTAGYTEHIFALCFLLGYEFMPRIKDLKDQQLYRVDKNTSYEKLDSLLSRSVDLELIIEQWDQMIRVACSLKNRITPANVIVKRLLRNSPSDKLSKAFRNLGRLIKTDYILRYITDINLRRKVQRQLNKGEYRHILSRWLFFANQGKFQIGDYEEIMNKASCLSLVSNAVLYWNTIHISKIIDELRSQGQEIKNETLSHISLLPYKHVIPMGTYFVKNSDSVNFDIPPSKVSSYYS